MIKKIVRNLKNPKQTVIKIFEDWMGREVPTAVTKMLHISGKDMRGMGYIKTYDGSGQACHPTIATFKGAEYLACTPYPYGKEYYENPCIYVRDSSHRKWKPIPTVFPIVRIKKMRFEHYSDPCLFCRNDKLALVFRKCERRTSGKIDQLYIATSENGTDWTKPVLLAEQAGDQLISPAAGIDGQELFCVEYDGGIDSRIVRYEFSHAALGEKHICGIKGLSSDFFVWHIDVLRDLQGGLKGLFMLRRKDDAFGSKLALFAFSPEENVWSWDRDFPLSDEEQREIKTIYKSCFLPNEERILCSARDIKDRWFLFEKDF